NVGSNDQAGFDASRAAKRRLSSRTDELVVPGIHSPLTGKKQGSSPCSAQGIASTIARWCEPDRQPFDSWSDWLTVAELPGVTLRKLPRCLACPYRESEVRHWFSTTTTAFCLGEGT